MGRRIVAIICIMFLLFTITSPISGSIFSYADENSGLSDQQKAALAVSTYMNYRKGYFVGSTAGVVSLMKSYVDDFFVDSANNTGINSYSDFSSHITVGKNNSGNWSVNIDNTGLVFLDNLVKWLLGKNKFPNLKSGGSWGSGNTVDNAYSGYIYGDNLFYIIDTRNNQYIFPCNYVNASYNVQNGSPVNGCTSEYIVGQLQAANGDLHMNENVNIDVTNVNISCQYAANITKNMTIKRSFNTTNPDSFPAITTTSSTSQLFYCDRVYKCRGNCAWYIDISQPTKYFYGIIGYNTTLDRYYYTQFGVYQRTDIPAVSSSNIDLNTNNFDQNDVGDDQDPDAPTQSFTPQYTDDNGNTYNYYNDNNVNNFYNSYTNNYTYNTNNVYNKTIIIKEESSEDPDDPEEPETPGGTTPPWDNSSGAGTLIPDGNGGYNFNLPDLTLPDLNIDWSINGLKDKFPFSIPWDLMAFFTVLNAEPETPEFTGQVDLGISIWNIDIDLHDFDLVAALVRNLEFIAFCIGLIIVTRSIIKG